MKTVIIFFRFLQNFRNNGKKLAALFLFLYSFAKDIQMTLIRVCSKISARILAQKLIDADGLGSNVVIVW